MPYKPIEEYEPGQGMNYFLKYPPCPFCDRAHKSLHIGKDLAGWRFRWHGYTEKELRTYGYLNGIHSLHSGVSWEQFLQFEVQYNYASIMNENGGTVAVHEFLQMVQARSEHITWGLRSYAKEYPNDKGSKPDEIWGNDVVFGDWS